VTSINPELIQVDCGGFLLRADGSGRTRFAFAFSPKSISKFSAEADWYERYDNESMMRLLIDGCSGTLLPQQIELIASVLKLIGTKVFCADGEIDAQNIPDELIDDAFEGYGDAVRTYLSHKRRSLQD
jgi:hypothetical protein